jgi:E3 ubiquitin-protein ligase MYCBP2
MQEHSLNDEPQTIKRDKNEIAEPIIDAVCRFCQNELSFCYFGPSSRRVCASKSCKVLLNTACTQVLACGHACSGVLSESTHFGCGKCNEIYCVCGELCVTEPSIRLTCGHTIHLNCAHAQYRVASLIGKIIPPRCGFPGCKILPEHPLLHEEFTLWQRILNQIEIMLPRLICEEHLELEADHVNNPMSEYYQNVELFARERFVFYMCGICKMPYYGGLAICGENEEKVKSEKYICRTCETMVSHEICPKHGDIGMIYKCFWCCNPATFYCFGTTHFCTECHNQWERAQVGPYPSCTSNCQFIGHPPNGQRKKYGICQFCLGERT